MMGSKSTVVYFNCYYGTWSTIYSTVCDGGAHCRSEYREEVCSFGWAQQARFKAKLEANEWHKLRRGVCCSGLKVIAFGPCGYLATYGR
mmetsp:Transcript_14611/g.37827  ORF Transcript_14611/g.37827 Transcript_14611/m.37827 type:complete len:89 (+) Transcript_14611:385-651(+)